MTEAPQENQSPSFVDKMKALAKKYWTILWKPTAKYSLGTLAIGGFALGIVFWGGFNWTMELTNTEGFCITCHEMRANVYEEYKGTVHDTNPSGVRASCPDCHVPKPWIYKIRRKIQASNELWHWARGSIDTREEFEHERPIMAQRVWTVMKKTDSRECRNCHTFMAMDVTLQERRARNRHLQAEDEGKTCIDCHKGIAHELPENALELERAFNKKYEK
jgi:cytochrome c-type protein NapC